MTAKAILGLLMAGIISCNSPEVMDHVVIGGGLMGSATAWQLAQQGNSVLLLEQQEENYSFGSSFGETRITRSLGPPDDLWSYLHNRAVAETKGLIDFLNLQDSQKHRINEVYTTSPVSYVRHLKQQAWVEAILKDQKDPYQLAENPRMAKELFGMNISDSTIVVREFKEYSGTLNPTSLIRKLHRAISLSGNEIWYGHRVDQAIPRADHYELKTIDLKSGASKTIRARKLVTASGPFTGDLLKHLAPYFKELIVPQRVFLAFLQIPDSVYENFSNDQRTRLTNSYPVINSASGKRSESFFSMIEHTTERGTPIIKIGGHYQRNPVENLLEVWRHPLSKAEIDWSIKHTLSYLQNLELPVSKLEFIKGYSCVYSLTRSEVPYVTTIEETKPSLVVVGGMSGIGAKGAMSYGLLAANLLSGITEPHHMYQRAENELGYQRLRQDLAQLSAWSPK